MSEHCIDDLVAYIHKSTGHVFQDLELLREALTHPSLLCKGKRVSYERLEFLGDAILNAIVSEMLYKLFPDDNEGSLTRKRTSLVCGSQVVEVAKSINLGKFILMSYGESSCGGETNSSNLENVLEALIGAIYIDGKIKVASDFILGHWRPLAECITSTPKDPKTALQEWSQKRDLAIPIYKLISKSGLEHNPIFSVEVTVRGYGSAAGAGHNKKAAEQEAAQALLKIIRDEDCHE